MKRVLGSDDVESPEGNVGGEIGRSAERNSTGPSAILSTCARAGSAVIHSQSHAVATVRTIECILHHCVFRRSWRLVRPLDFSGAFPQDVTPAI